LHLVGILFPHVNDNARSKSHQAAILFNYMMEVASNYMFRPLWWLSSGCT